MTNFDHMRHRLLARAGLIEPPKVDRRKSIGALQKSEWSPLFEQLMRNRLIFGALRYGLMGDPGKPQYDRLASIIKRLGNYAMTGNMEMLVDAANLCLLEFVECNHPKKHFHSDESVEHVSKI